MSDETKHPKLTGAFDLFSKSYEVVQRNLTVFAIVYILPLVTLLGRFGVDNKGSRFSTRWASNSGLGGLPTGALFGLLGFGLILAVVFIIISFFIRAMTYQLELEGATGKQPSLQHLFNKAKRYWLRLAGLTILVGIMAVVGLVLLIIPGLIVIRRYFLAPYVLIDKDVSITEAMQQSAEMTKPHSGYIWSIIGVSVLISLANIIPFIGFLIAFTLGIAYSVAPALRYEELKKLGSTTSISA